MKTAYKGLKISYSALFTTRIACFPYKLQMDSELTDHNKYISVFFAEYYYTKLLNDVEYLKRSLILMSTYIFFTGGNEQNCQIKEKRRPKEE